MVIDKHQETMSSHGLKKWVKRESRKQIIQISVMQKVFLFLFVKVIWVQNRFFLTTILISEADILISLPFCTQNSFR